MFENLSRLPNFSKLDQYSCFLINQSDKNVCQNFLKQIVILSNCFFFQSNIPKPKKTQFTFFKRQREAENWGTESSKFFGIFAQKIAA